MLKYRGYYFVKFLTLISCMTVLFPNSTPLGFKSFFTSFSIKLFHVITFYLFFLLIFDKIVFKTYSKLSDVTRMIVLN